MASRCVSFACPVCRLKHCQDTAVDRRVDCGGTPVYFTDDWEPTLEPTLRGTSPSDLPGCLAWILLLLIVFAGQFFLGARP